jgi:transposase
MPFKRTKPALELSDEARKRLEAIRVSRTESVAHVERARILLGYADGASIYSLARQLGTNRPKVERCINKALQLGPMAALSDLPRPGKPRTITAEARAWVISLACQKPVDLGYSYELWTMELLARHIRQHCEAQGHPSLLHLARGTVSKMLRQSQTRPHKVTYYVERRDPEFESKMAQVLYVYKEVQLELAQQGTQEDGPSMIAYLSYDEKPGIQALGNTSPDRMPVAGKHPTIYRDYEYVRYGTLSLIAGIDLLTGEVHGIVRDRHRSAEFIEFLKLADTKYPSGTVIRIVLDNHSAHISKQTRAYLATVPNRFDFVFTPKHGSWLNLVENFFSKLTRTMLRGIRVQSKEELAARLVQYLDEINHAPIVFRWKYGLDAISIV